MRTTTTLRHSFIALGLVIGLGQVQAQNAYLDNVSLSRYTKAGVNYTISAWCRNLSAIPYTNVSISWRLDNGAWNNMTATNIGGGGITTNNYLPLSHPLALNAAQGPHTLEVKINTPNDSDPTNNIVTVPFTALTNYAHKVALLEARTETWCPQCPPSNDLTNELMTNPDYAVAKFHLSDALVQCTECVTYYNQHNINYTPAGIIEMGEYGGYAISSNYNQWEPTLENRVTGVSPVELTMTKSVNQTTRVLTVTLSRSEPIERLRSRGPCTGTSAERALELHPQPRDARHARWLRRKHRCGTGRTRGGYPVFAHLHVDRASGL